MTYLIATAIITIGFAPLVTLIALLLTGGNDR